MKKIAIIIIFFMMTSLTQAMPQLPQTPLEQPESFLDIEKPQHSIKGSIEDTYQNLIPLDITFENGLDPYEQQDNYTCQMSPYPLIRTVMPLFCKKVTIPPGYYLLTPRKINGRTYILYKQTGKVLCSIPVFEEKQIDPEKEYPKAEDPYESAPMGLRSAFKVFGVISGRRTPIPKIPQYKTDCFAYDDQFYGINIYYKDRLYKTLYKSQIYE